jgi:hypothetical protein
LAGTPAASAAVAYATVQAWLDALDARAYAGMDGGPAFRVAQDRTNEAIDLTRLDDRRHGMDFKTGAWT